MQQIFIFIQIFCAILAACILVYLFSNGRKFSGTNSYMICLTLFLMWNLAEVLLLMSQTPKQEILALKVKFLPVVYIGVSWLYFCLVLIGAKLTSSRLFRGILIGFPAGCYLFLLTNEYHHLFFTEIIFKTALHRGPVFWIHTAESYLCILIGTICFFLSMKRKTGKSIKFCALLVIAVLLPLMANLLMLCGIIPNQGMDITAQVLLVTLVLFGRAVYHKKFLNLLPVAARHFVENMSDGIIIMDHENFIVGINDAVKRIFPEIGIDIYDPAEKILQYLLTRDNSTAGSELSADLKNSSFQGFRKGMLDIGGKCIHFEIRVLTGFRRQPAGKMLILEDRTEERGLLDEIQNKNILLTKTNERLTTSNQMLTEANNRLAQLSETIEELAVTRERNRVEREVHDAVGHTLTLLIALAENVKAELNEDQQEVQSKMDKSIELSRLALNDIRDCLKGIGLDSFKETKLAEWMNQLVKINASSKTEVVYSIPDKMPDLDAERLMAIYRICQESITNAIRHGKAKTVNIIFKTLAHSVRLYIFSDGEGCGEIVKGFGLKGMEDRVSRFGGNISFRSDGEKGFNIIADIPAG